MDQILRKKEQINYRRVRVNQPNFPWKILLARHMLYC